MILNPFSNRLNVWNTLFQIITFGNEWPFKMPIRMLTDSSLTTHLTIDILTHNHVSHLVNYNHEVALINEPCQEYIDNIYPSKLNAFQ